jgi:hypothetical protein
MITLFLIAVLLAIIKGLYDGITDSLKGVNRLEIVETVEVNDSKLYLIQEEIAHLETIIQRDFEIGKLLELELEKVSGNKRITILNKLTTLDNRTYRNIKKLNKLKEELKELE